MGTMVQVDRYYNLLYKPIEAKFLKPMAKLDNLITRNLRDARINTRPAGANGLWCFTLLPTVLILYSLLYEVSPAYKMAACLSAGMLFYGVLFNLFMSVSCLVLTQEVGGGCFASGLIASTLVYNVVKQDILFVTIFALPSALLFSRLLRRLLSYPSTFTIGEATIVAQSVVISAIVMLAMVTCNLGDTSTEMHLVNTVVMTVLSTVGLIVTALYMLDEDARTVKNLSYILTSAAGFALFWLHLALGFNAIARVAIFLFLDRVRVTLIAFWASLVALAVVVLVGRTRMEGKATTVMRKAFHVLAAAVFASGILYDLKLMEMAAGIGFGLLVFVEALRKSKIEPISSALQSAFLVYSDEKDSGQFALTPIYMYCGLGLGLLSPAGAAALERLAGVLAVGVGDAAASWFGARYGERKWAGQNRTVEGTIFNVLSQIMTVYCLGLFGAVDLIEITPVSSPNHLKVLTPKNVYGKRTYLAMEINKKLDIMNCNHAVLRTAIAATVSGLVEAKTDQVDNLILPLVTLLAFQLTYLIS